MQIGRRAGVTEPVGFWHETFHQLEDAVGAIDEAAQEFIGIDT